MERFSALSSLPLRIINRKIAIAALTGLLAVVLIIALIAIDVKDCLKKSMVKEPNFFIGVDVGFGDEDVVYNVSNAIHGYANLIIIGSLNITTDTEKLTRVCDYLYQEGFYFIVYVGFAKVSYLPPQGPDEPFFKMAFNRWGDRFLGAYMFDEVGGKQIDRAMDRPVPVANNFSDAANHFLLEVDPFLSIYKGTVYYDFPSLRLYTSDYALYWYDYLCGYDVVFAEFVQDQRRDVTASLCRGAAKSLNKDWGVIVTFGVCGQPGSCLENATALYDDMVFAWQSGARYVLVFDGLGTNGTATTPYGILTQEHFDAIKKFWNDVNADAEIEEFPANAAFVLPRDYGYGFRGPNDRIWGLWNADALSGKVWEDVNSLIVKYDNKLDVVYETKIDGIHIDLPYDTLVFWNGTIIQRSTRLG